MCRGTSLDLYRVHVCCLKLCESLIPDWFFGPYSPNVFNPSGSYKSFFPSSAGFLLLCQVFGYGSLYLLPSIAGWHPLMTIKLGTNLSIVISLTFFSLVFGSILGLLTLASGHLGIVRFGFPLVAWVSNWTVISHSNKFCVTIVGLIFYYGKSFKIICKKEF